MAFARGSPDAEAVRIGLEALGLTLEDVLIPVETQGLFSKGVVSLRRTGR